jgi:hypothetical protein
MGDKDADGPGKGDKIGWKWKAEPTTVLADFGDPTSTTDYALCIYDEAPPTLIAGFEIPAASPCGDDACWRAVADKGFKFSDPAATFGGASRVIVRAEPTPGRARITLKGKGANLLFATLPPVPNVVVQLIRDDSAICWETVHPLSSVKTSTTKAFKSTIP